MSHRNRPLRVISLLAMCILLLGSAPLGPADAARPADLAWDEAIIAAADKTAVPAVPLALQYGMDVSPQPAGSTAFENSLQSVKDLGFTYAQYYLSWKDVEPSKDVIKWDWLNPILAQGTMKSVKIVFRIYQTPSWARPPNPETSPYPCNTVELARFVQALIDRYGSMIAGYVIWNEPNTVVGWEGRPVSPQAYMDMLYEVHKGAKAVTDKPSTIISAGLAPTQGSGSQSMSDISYLDALYKLPKKDSHAFKDLVDVVGMNGFGFGKPPEDTSDPDGLNFNRLDRLHQVMVNNGDATRPVWALEVGWLAFTRNRLPNFDNYKVPSPLQALYLRRAMNKVMLDWPWMTVMFIWNLDFGPTYPDPLVEREKQYFAVQNREAYNCIKLVAPQCPAWGPKVRLPLLRR